VLKKVFVKKPRRFYFVKERLSTKSLLAISYRSLNFRTLKLVTQQAMKTILMLILKNSHSKTSAANSFFVTFRKNSD
jgi:hypothetical protein